MPKSNVGNVSTPQPATNASSNKRNTLSMPSITQQKLLGKVFGLMFPTLFGCISA
jgi:hypothetical protein